MKLRQPSSRWALWAFAAALLLKSAMPWLANASAQMQGKSLVEVCTVYGVALVPPGGDAPAPADHPAEHAGTECALTGLVALAAFEPPVAALPPAPRPSADPPRAHPSSQARDACAAWVARRKHGPPTLA